MLHTGITILMYPAMSETFLILNPTTVVNAYLLYIDLYVLLKAVSVQVENQVMYEIKSVTHDDQRQLVGQLSFLKHRCKHIQDISFHSTTINLYSSDIRRKPPHDCLFLRETDMFIENMCLSVKQFSVGVSFRSTAQDCW